MRNWPRSWAALGISGRCWQSTRATGRRPKPIRTAEGKISIAMPQVRNTAERFVSQVIPDTKAVVRTRPLEALIIGSYVRGLSDRDIESLAKEAELGHVSKSTVSRICRELRDRYTAF